jgi:choline dehydrogenase
MSAVPRPDCPLYDVVVVGSGSAGGIVAARLSEDADCRVLLVEAGPDFPLEAEQPPGFLAGGSVYAPGFVGAGPPTPDVDWSYWSEPLPRSGRRLRLPRGKLVGGSSMTNGCVAVRGRPSDFDGWAERGAPGWSWAEVLPYVELVEREIPIMTYPRELWMPIHEAFASAALELGLRWHDDLNAPDAWDDVVGPWPRNRRNEVRQGTLVTYIRAARPRANFEILDRTLVDSVVLEGDRAVGVRCPDTQGVRREIRASRVVLSAGAYGTPPILLRSGIGPASELAEFGIPCAVDLPVGRGLLEHPGMMFRIGLDPAVARMGWPVLAAIGRGPGWWANPVALDGEAGLAAILFNLAVCDEPRGSIRLASRDPQAPPLIDHHYSDMLGRFDECRGAFDAILATAPFRAADARDFDAELPFAERVEQFLVTGSHPVGGCAIGAVVDPELNVLGVEGLTVADASVLPRNVSNNTNLTCFMVGERAAAFLRGGGGRDG